MSDPFFPKKNRQEFHLAKLQIQSLQVISPSWRGYQGPQKDGAFLDQEAENFRRLGGNSYDVIQIDYMYIYSIKIYQHINI